MGERQREGFEERDTDRTPKAADRAMWALGGYHMAARVWLSQSKYHEDPAAVAPSPRGTT
jgi:hypothetical protein